MAGGGEVKLLGFWASPFVARAKLALHLKGVTYDYVEEDIFHCKSDLLLASNPVNKTVPVLIHRGNPITESQVIVQYIDEAFGGGGPSSLLPADPHERAAARFWAAYIDHELGPPWRWVFVAKTEEERAEWLEKAAAAADPLEEGLRQCSKGKGFFGGDGVGYVDVVLGGMAPWLKATEVVFGVKIFDGARAPLLAAWLERFGELDAAKAVLQDVDAVAEYIRMLPSKLQARAAAAADKN